MSNRLTYVQADSDLKTLPTRAEIERKVHCRSVSERKLAQLDAAKTLDFLRSPPGNRLEGLKGDRVGQYSIRVNDQFRVCFVWTDSGPADVEIADYH